ncbi:hypothetical protein LTR15_006302 [Elasticomyces elasticus]|nr:hypothetical protein LTR15_006302 [Elasticomyces elasticus]
MDIQNALPQPNMAQSQRRDEPPEGILKTIMNLRGLNISEESTFDFEPPEQWRPWPGARYGQESPHLQFAKATKATRAKHAATPIKPTRPAKARKPKAASPVKQKPSQPSTLRGVIPQRVPPAHLLTLPPELRNRVYELVAVHDEPQYPQLRPVLAKDRVNGQRLSDDRRFPLEPSLALVNHQLREEVLSVFYGCNRFIFKNSMLLPSFRMTSPTMQKLWKAARPASHYLQQIELHVTSQRLPLDYAVTFKIKRLLDGGFEISHDMAEKTSYCCCLEDSAIAETMIQARGESDVMHVLHILCTKRNVKLADVAVWGEDGLYMMPATRCEHCEKANIVMRENAMQFDWHGKTVKGYAASLGYAKPAHKSTSRLHLVDA